MIKSKIVEIRSFAPERIGWIGVNCPPKLPVNCKYGNNKYSDEYKQIVNQVEFYMIGKAVQPIV